MTSKHISLIKKEPLEKLLEKEIWKAYGAVSTPGWVVELMVRLAGIKKWENLKILEPGCGLCEFLNFIYQRYPKNYFIGVEAHPEIFQYASLLYPQFEILLADFLLWETNHKYDLIIGNPPYGIIGDKSHYPIHYLKPQKEIYKNLFKTWYGKYNIYGAFVEKAIYLLKNKGKLVYIIPATFMILDEFKFLRKFLAISGKIKIYYLGPKIFNNKNVSTVILIFIKGLRGIELYEVKNGNKFIKYYKKEQYQGEIIRFETQETKEFEKDKIPLGEVFDIYFAARSPEVKKHPLVSKKPKGGLVPILTGRNLHKGWIDYEKCYSGFYIPQKYASALRDFYAIPHIVVGHTKGGKVISAIDKKCYPWREELHLIPKNNNVNLEKISEYLNCDEVQKYMKALYKEITPHITITQLKLLPIPSNFIKGRLL